MNPEYGWDDRGFDPECPINRHGHSVRVKAPEGFEASEPHTPATAIALVNVLLDSWEMFSDEIGPLVAQAHELRSRNDLR